MQVTDVVGPEKSCEWRQEMYAKVRNPESTPLSKTGNSYSKP